MHSRRVNTAASPSMLVLRSEQGRGIEPHKVTQQERTQHNITSPEQARIWAN